MSKLIVGGDSPIEQPFDRYWDAPMTRREAQVLFRKLAANDSELMGMCDTAALLINFICEKKVGITDRKEVDDYVELKKAQMAAEREQMKKDSDAQQNCIQ
jgi:hypothetical protein